MISSLPLLQKQGKTKKKNLFAHLSVILSPPPKTLNMSRIFFSVDSGALIFGIHNPCDKTFELVHCFGLDLWLSSMSDLLIIFNLYDTFWNIFNGAENIWRVVFTASPVHW